MSWPRPFTWRDYPITGYLIECRDSQSELLHSHINGTEIVNAPVVNQTVELPQDIPDCYSFQCSVTASNNLDESPSSITNISFPLCMLFESLLLARDYCCVTSFAAHISPKPAVDLVKMLMLEDGRPGIAICVKVGLPLSCVSCLERLPANFYSLAFSVVSSYPAHSSLSSQFCVSSRV